MKKLTGIKLTPQRLAILDYLEGNLGHPSALEVYKAISKSFPTVSFATVYNTLELFREKGIVAQLLIDPDKKRFDSNPEPHHHLICVKCKEIVDISSTYPLDLTDKERRGYEIIGNHVDFYGICPACQKEKNTDQDLKQ